MIPRRELGICPDCCDQLTYNVHAVPFCDRCDQIRFSRVCYHCGDPGMPEFDEQAKLHYCLNCDNWRRDFTFPPDGKGTGKSRVARFGYALGVLARKVMPF